MTRQVPSRTCTERETSHRSDAAVLGPGRASRQLHRSIAASDDEPLPGPRLRAGRGPAVRGRRGARHGQAHGAARGRLARRSGAAGRPAGPGRGAKTRRSVLLPRIHSGHRAARFAVPCRPWNSPFAASSRPEPPTATAPTAPGGSNPAYRWAPAENLQKTLLTPAIGSRLCPPPPALGGGGRVRPGTRCGKRRPAGSGPGV